MIVALAHAMGAPGGGGGAQGAPGMLQSLLPLVLIFVIFYFLLIRPQQKKAKEHRAMLDNLKKGDRVITSGGIYGTVYSLTSDSVMLIVSENVKVKVSRAYIAALAGSDEGEAEKS